MSNLYSRLCAGCSATSNGCRTMMYQFIFAFDGLGTATDAVT